MDSEPVTIEVEVDVDVHLKREPTSEDEADDDDTAEVDFEPPPISMATATTTGRRTFHGSLAEALSVDPREIDYLLEEFACMNSRRLSVDSLEYGPRDDDEEELEFERRCTLCDPPTVLPRGGPDLVLRHAQARHGLRASLPYGCRVCSVGCRTRDTIEKHVRAEQLDFEGLFLCQLCDKEFDSRRDVRLHTSEHWDALKNSECTSPHLGFKCRYCSCLFWSEIDREKHHCQSHFHEHRDHFFKCDACSTVFSDKIWWTCHHIQEHGLTKEDFKRTCGYVAYRCTLCCSVSLSTSSLQDHFSKVHPEQMRLYCTVDGCTKKPFKDLFALDNHNKIYHTGRLQEEERSVVQTNDSAPKLFSCPRCKMEFGNKNLVQKHLWNCRNHWRS